MNNQKKLALGGVLSYIAIGLSIVTGVIYTPLLINTIGESDYALFNLTITFVSFFLVDFGISTAVSRYISIYNARSEYEKVDNFLGITMKIFLVIDLLIFLFLFIGYFLLENIFLELSMEEIFKLKKIYLIVSAFSVLSFPFTPLNGILVAYEEFVPLKIIEILQKIVSFLLLVSVVILNQDLYLIVFINSFSNFFSILLKELFIRKNLNVRVNIKYRDSKIMRELFNFSLWSTIILISQRLILNIGPTILGAFSGTRAIAIFSVGSSIEGYFWLFSNALNSLFLPSVSRVLYSKKNKDSSSELLNMMIKVGRIQLMISGALFTIFAVVGKDFLNIWLGSNFQDSYRVIMFLVLPGVVTYTQTIAYNYLTITNEIKYRAYSFLGSAVISFVLAILLTPRFGADGMAISACVGIIIGQIILLNYFLYKKFDMNIFHFFVKTHVRLVPFFIAVLISFTLLENVLLSNTLGKLILKVFIYCIIYMILLLILGTNGKEKRDIYRLIKRIF